jgi:DNA invertase Pin-like site-specific DNA recombinase
MAGKTVGYARTSTADQAAGLDAQIRDLKDAGCEKIFSEQVSSVAERKQLTACLDYLREDDTLMVTKPDRLARSTADLLGIEADLAKRGVALVVKSMGLDTRGNGSNPTTRLQLTILAAVAQFEREIMLERQREGIQVAKAQGKYKGRPADTNKHDEIRRLHAEGMAASEIAKRVEMARSNVYRIIGETRGGTLQCQKKGGGLIGTQRAAQSGKW